MTEVVENNTEILIPKSYLVDGDHFAISTALDHNKGFVREYESLNNIHFVFKEYEDVPKGMLPFILRVDADLPEIDCIMTRINRRNGWRNRLV